MGRLSDSRSPTGLPTERPARRVPPRAGAQGDPRPAADNASASPVTAAEAGSATDRAASSPGTDPAAGPEPGRCRAETLQGPESQTEEGQARGKGLRRLNVDIRASSEFTEICSLKCVWYRCSRRRYGECPAAILARRMCPSQRPRARTYSLSHLMQTS